MKNLIQRKIKEHRLLASKNLRADLSKFLIEIWSSLSQCEWIMSIFKRVGLSKYSKNLKKRQSQSWLSFLISSKIYEEPYPARIKEHRFLTSKNLRADLSKFLTEIWSSLSQCDRIRRIFKRVGLSKYRKNLKQRQP